MKTRGFSLSFAVCIVSAMLVGCTATQPSRFYVLDALQASRQGIDRTCEKKDRIITIGLAPIGLPRYLDRPQIMTRIGEHELGLSEVDLWADPLKDMIPRVLARNLGALLCADVQVYPWRGPETFSYRLLATVTRLDGSPGGEAFLHVRWTILDEQANRVLLTRESRYAEPVGSPDYTALAAAYSRLFDAFSREIAEAFGSFSLGGQLQQK